MRTITKTYKLYKFSELSEKAKEKALEKMQDINVDEGSDWDSGTLDDCKTIAGLIGITIDKIYFSGFSSQGDGACFEGSYKYKNGAIKALAGYCPIEPAVFYIARQLRKLQKENHYALRASVKHSGHYYHKYCTEIDVTDENEDTNEFINITKETSEKLEELLRDFMEWIYRQLEKQYDYLTSKEAIIETIEANDYDFSEEGNFPAY